jgi:transcription antitermination factor NusG
MNAQNDSNWVKKGLIVSIEDESSSYHGFRGIVRSIDNGKVTLELEMQDQDDTITVNVDIDKLQTAVPEKGAKVIVVKGEYRGMVGQMVSSEETEKIAVVRMTDGQHKVLEWFRITPMEDTQ